MAGALSLSGRVTSHRLSCEDEVGVSLLSLGQQGHVIIVVLLGTSPVVVLLGTSPVVA